MSQTPILAMPYIVSSQAQKEITHNDALNDLDCLAQLSVLDRTLNAPPSSPNEGDTYIVGSFPTGAWEGHANDIAAYYSGWKFKTPKTGWMAFAQNDNTFLYYTGSLWAVWGTPCLDATTTWNPGTIANGSVVLSSAISLSGAAFGDTVCVAAPYSLQGVVATAYVSTSNAVVICLQNMTGAGVTLGSGTWRVRARKG